MPFGVDDPEGLVVSSSSWPVGIVPCPLVLLQVQTCSAVQSMRLELRILLPPSFSPGAWVLGTPALLRPRGEGGLCQAACSAGHRLGPLFLPLLQVGGVAAGCAGRLAVDARLAEELGPRGLFQDEGPAP